MRRDKSHDPYSKSKNAILRMQKINSVTDNNKKPYPQFGGKERPFHDITTTHKVDPKKVALTSGKIYPWMSKKTSYSRSTHKQKKSRYAATKEG